MLKKKTPDELASEVQNILLDAASNHIPKRKNKKQKYISDESLRLIDERRDMKKKGLNLNNALYKEK